MGQKTHPVGLRLGVIKSWDANWFDAKHLAKKLGEDFKVRNYIRARKKNCGISRILVERTAAKMLITLETSRPGLVFGRGGVDLQHLEEELRHLTKQDVRITVNEITTPELDALLVAENIASQLSGRANFRRAMKFAISSTMKAGAQGIKVMCSGRLGGAEMARTEIYKEGRTPLHTIRADIDYATAEALTIYGIIGIKVWICKGEVIGKRNIEFTE
ncbi:MAG: 30S ribosomal protein S3 [Ignavibacteria bacterium]|jgi:small subunit ribosomal protein S3|nr:30S ribosomal protein S3 [Ignavibacteria bacterium]